ncbi:anti-sigma factor antagonist [Paracoccus sp. (in: a-proteobacteria)]|uniref:anti-sigma factor antagonist n=1 Tax=Paracoccus sp. TaxID=267 RepID=UPI002AFE4CE9|nr:anti-sigma factor antagonist [Paracoccus sp. (in: a-proteobacteria)]
MQLTLLPQPDGLIIRVDEKRLDAAIATAFKDRVRSMIAGGGPQITLDLGGVEFMDSSGLGAVIAIYKAIPAGLRLTLTGLTPNVERVIRLTRMDTVLNIRKTGAPPGQKEGPERWSTSPQPAEKRLRQPPPGRLPMCSPHLPRRPADRANRAAVLAGAVRRKRRERSDRQAGTGAGRSSEQYLRTRHPARGGAAERTAPCTLDPSFCVARHVGGIACAITDDGQPLPASCLEMRSLPWSDPAPRDPAKLISLPERGFGWFLIQELSASLSYFREGRRNFFRLSSFR